MGVSWTVPVYQGDADPVIPFPYILFNETVVDPPEVVHDVHYMFDVLPMLSPFAGRHCIMGGATKVDATPLRVTNADGTQNTILMAHKGFDPAKGSSMDPDQGNMNDEGWAHLGNYLEHKRYPTHMFQDQNHAFTESTKVFAHMGMSSPHEGSMPCVFADGSVRSVRYNTPSFVICALWCWDDGYQVYPD